MEKGSNDNDLIAKIVNETYENLSGSSQTQDKQELSEYFRIMEKSTQSKLLEIELNNYCLVAGSSFIPLEFNKAIQCFNLTLGGKSYSFPKNWSFFKKFKPSNELALIKLENTSDLWPVLKHLFPEENEYIFCFSFPNLYLIKGKSFSKKHVLDFRNKIKEAA